MSNEQTQQILAGLSKPLASDATSVTRRRFLQAVGAGATITALPGWMTKSAAAATPLGAGQGVVVMVTMAGGNDGLNTFIPIGDGAYYDARKGLAFSAGETLPMGQGRGLNPNLRFMKQLWDQKKLAVIDGVGKSEASLSHFVNMAEVMSSNPGAPRGTGWLGRYLDGLPNDPFTGVSIGNTVPILVRGRKHQAIGIPERGRAIFADNPNEPTERRQHAALAAMSVGRSGLGPLADAVTEVGARAVATSTQIQPLTEDRDDEAAAITKFRLAARLINANLGIRFISIMFGDFDTHANQDWMHQERMKELDVGLQTFYGTLDGKYADRTLLVGGSEFGRRVKTNGNGSDHGAANSWFAIANNINPGFHGKQPSLTNLDRYGNQIPTVDYRNVFANVTATWLRADAAEIIGRNYSDIGFLNPPARAAKPTPAPVPVSTSSVRQRRARITRLHLAAYLVVAPETQHEAWSQQLLGGSRGLGSIGDEIVESKRFRTKYGPLNDQQFVNVVGKNVLKRLPTATELKKWTSAIAGGKSRGQILVELATNDNFVQRHKKLVYRTELVAPIGRLYQAYFLRQPDSDGLDYWLDGQLALPVVSNTFAGSPEFVNRYGRLNNKQFVELVYRNVLARTPDAEGLNYWVRQLGQGKTRGDIMLGFSNSPEFIKKVDRLTP